MVVNELTEASENQNCAPRVNILVKVNPVKWCPDYQYTILEGIPLTFTRFEVQPFKLSNNEETLNVFQEPTLVNSAQPRLSYLQPGIFIGGPNSFVVNPQSTSINDTSPVLTNESSRVRGVLFLSGYIDLHLNVALLINISTGSFRSKSLIRPDSLRTFMIADGSMWLII